MPDSLLDPDLPTDPAPLDATRLQILATEHWGLLATRSMLWNEIFTRTGMFLTTVSGAVVALALIAQATGFDARFRVFALLILPVVLLLGIATLIRLGDAMQEEFMAVVGMNRLRNAYLRHAPDLAPHFVMPHHDDLGTLLQGVANGPRAGPSRMLSGTPVMVAIIDSVLAGVLTAVIIGTWVERLWVYATICALAGLATALVLAGIIPRRQIGFLRREYQPRFPAVAGDADLPRRP